MRTLGTLLLLALLFVMGCIIMPGCGTLNPYQQITPPTNTATQHDQTVTGGEEEGTTTKVTIRTPKPVEPVKPVPPISDVKHATQQSTPVPAPATTHPTSSIPNQREGEWQMEAAETSQLPWYWQALDYLLPGSPCQAAEATMPNGKTVTVDSVPPGTEIEISQTERRKKNDSSTVNDKSATATGAGWSGNQAPPDKFSTGTPPEVSLGGTKGDKTTGPSTGKGTGGSYEGPAPEVGGISILYWIGGLTAVAGLLVIVWMKQEMVKGIIMMVGGAAIAFAGWAIPNYGGLILLLAALAGVAFGLWWVWQHKQKIAETSDAAAKTLGDIVASNQRGLNALPAAVTAAVNSAVAATPDGQSAAPESAVRSAIDQVVHTVLGRISQQMAPETKAAVTQTKVENGIDLVIPGATPKP